MDVKVKDVSNGKAADQAAAATQRERPEPPKEPALPDQAAAEVEISPEARQAQADAASAESQESSDS